MLFWITAFYHEVERYNFMHLIRPCGAPSPQGEGFGAASSSAPAGHLSLRASFACKHAPGMFAEASKVPKGEASGVYFFSTTLSLSFQMLFAGTTPRTQLVG
jgi:hypothetical protein